MVGPGRPAPALAAGAPRLRIRRAERPTRPGTLHAVPGERTPAAGLPPGGDVPVRVRWGLGDFVIGFAAYVLGQFLGGLPFVHTRSDGTVRVDTVGATIAGIVVGTLCVVGAMHLVARQKGLGSNARDFGLGVSAADWGWVFAGLAFAYGATLALAPITHFVGHEPQEVVRDFTRASGAALLAYAACVVVLAPIAEELLFRGVLLRSLLRRVDAGWALFLSALVFGLVHVLGDPGSYAVLPALVALGLFSGWRALRTGALSQSILVHAGFNLLTALVIVGRR